MKDQDKNQKVPETKLTDEQLGEVNAGAIEFFIIGNAQHASDKCAADGNFTITLNLEKNKKKLGKII